MKFEDGALTPEGLDCGEAMAAWGPWVAEAVNLMDGDGAWAAWPEAGAYRDQPARDMAILSIARGRWVERRNQKMRAEMR